MQEIHLKPFNKNLRNFILCNGLSNSEFAEMLNASLEEQEIEIKAGGYSENDIWTYYRRGSLPRDERVLTAIAKIISKPLEKLLMEEIPEGELKRSFGKKNQTTQPVVAREKWNIAKMNELTDTERDFVCRLFTSDIHEENARYVSCFDVALHYNPGRTVELSYDFDDGYPQQKMVEWSWVEYGEEVRKFEGDEEYVIEKRVDEEFFDKFYTLGLVKDFYCVRYDLSHFIFEEDTRDTHGYFRATVFYEIGREEVIEILKKCVEKFQNDMAQLEKQKEEKAT